MSESGNSMILIGILAKTSSAGLLPLRALNFIFPTSSLTNNRVSVLDVVCTQTGTQHLRFDNMTIYYDTSGISLKVQQIARFEPCKPHENPYTQLINSRSEQ